jgi:long-chain acyl-CoA synthetase
VGTLGPVLEGVEVRIDPDTGEIQTRSPAVMKGYYKNPALTAEVMTSDGWIKTGDVGYFKGKRLVISGRIKEMILTASGENIFPEAIESMLNHMDFVEESLIIPEDGKLLALIKLDMASFVSSFKGRVGDEKERALSYIQELREKINSVLPSNSRINEVEIQETPFERTPTSKIKRLAIIMSRKKKQ